MAVKISKFYKYEVEGKEFQLRFKTPNIGDQIRIGQTYAALKGGFSKLDDVSDNLAFVTATLNNVIIDKPEELKLDELDVDSWQTLNTMFKDYQEFAFFRKENRGG